MAVSFRDVKIIWLWYDFNMLDIIIWLWSLLYNIIYIYFILVGGIPTPLKNISSSIGMMTFPTEWRNKTCSKPLTRYDCNMLVNMLISYDVLWFVMVYAQICWLSPSLNFKWGCRGRCHSRLRCPDIGQGDMARDSTASLPSCAWEVVLGYESKPWHPKGTLK